MRTAWKRTRGDSAAIRRTATPEAIQFSVVSDCLEEEEPNSELTYEVANGAVNDHWVQLRGVFRIEPATSPDTNPSNDYCQKGFRHAADHSWWGADHRLF